AFNSRAFSCFLCSTKGRLQDNLVPDKDAYRPSSTTCMILRGRRRRTQITSGGVQNMPASRASLPTSLRPPQLDHLNCQSPSTGRLDWNSYHIAPCIELKCCN